MLLRLEVAVMDIKVAVAVEITLMAVEVVAVAVDVVVVEAVEAEIKTVRVSFLKMYGITCLPMNESNMLKPVVVKPRNVMLKMVKVKVVKGTRKPK